MEVDIMKITKEEALRRLNLAKEIKRRRTNEIVEEMKEQFVRETGMEPKYVEIW